MSDHYVKKFDTSDHLISMLFSTFANCTSLREVAASMLGLKGKMNHFQLKHIPYRSTLSDANKRRSHLVFQDVYYSLLKEYHSIISDSRQTYAWENRLEIIDSSTISLFKDILSCVGRRFKHRQAKRRYQSAYTNQFTRSRAETNLVIRRDNARQTIFEAC